MTYTHRYVPFLRWKRGEHNALVNLQASTKPMVTPMIMIGSDNFKDTKATKVVPLLPAPQSFAQDLLKFWGTRPIFLDASHLGVGSLMGTPLSLISQAVRAAGGNIIPAVRGQHDRAYIQEAIRVARSQSSGLALVVKLGEATTLRQWFPDLGFPAVDVDLIINLQDDVAAALAFMEQLSKALVDLWSAAQFRSITFVGTSIPTNFTGYQPGAYTIDRHEWQFWQALFAAKLPFRPDYGDYATVSVQGPPSMAINAPVNAKYTLPTQFLICKGVKPRGSGGIPQPTQLIDHAKTISGAHGAFGLGSCWGDQMISNIAAGSQPPSGPVQWVGYSINRHIELVRSQLP